MADLVTQVDGKRNRVNGADCKKIMTKAANEAYQESRQTLKGIQKGGEEDLDDAIKSFIKTRALFYKRKGQADLLAM